jgi:hypothetical protein
VLGFSVEYELCIAFFEMFKVFLVSDYGKLCVAFEIDMISIRLWKEAALLLWNVWSTVSKNELLRAVMSVLGFGVEI